jgi:hypothetical protein
VGCSLTCVVLHVDGAGGKCAGRVCEFGVDIEGLFEGLVHVLNKTILERAVTGSYTVFMTPLWGTGLYEWKRHDRLMSV